MAVYVGKDGKVVAGATTLAQITDWSFNAKSNNAVWASSSTGGYKTRAAGVKDGTGSFSFKIDDTTQQWDSIEVGTLVSLTLYLDSSNYITVPAIIDDVTYDCNINEGEPPAGKANFGITAAWTMP